MDGVLVARVFFPRWQSLGQQIKPPGQYDGGNAMDSTIAKFWDAAHKMLDSLVARLPALIVAAIVFVLFYAFSVLVTHIIRRATPRRRQNLGVVFGRLIGGACILLGFLVAFSIVAPSFQAADLIKILGISGVAIGFAFQNILQNFLAGLLLLWAEPFRVGDEIKLDAFEGTVEEIQTRATIIRTYDEREVVIPNADLFTRSVIVNTAFSARRWEYDLTLKSVQGLAELKADIVKAVASVPGVLAKPAPEALVVNIDAPNSEAAKLRVLWWTNAPRQHQMLSSYDRVLTAIAGVHNGSGDPAHTQAA
jgi:small conductance mechanosensitive channel